LLQGAYLAGDLGPGGEDVLRRKLLQRSSESISQRQDHSSGSVAESIAAGMAVVDASEAATESVAYTEDFETDGAVVTRDESIVDEVGDETGVGSYTLGDESIEDEMDGAKAPTTQRTTTAASASQVRHVFRLFL
jgi:hypothetical protein